MHELTVTSMKERQIYTVRDVRTSNPRKLFRRMSDALEELGYETDYDTGSVEIKRDEVGESGYVTARLIADKNIAREEQGRGGRTLDLKNASDLQKYSLVAGLILFVTGVVLIIIPLIMGIAFLLSGLLIALIALFSMVKRRSAIISYPVSVWITGSGEIYRVHLSQSRGAGRGEQGVEQDQIISELTIRIAAESDPPARLEELNEDINWLVHSLEAVE